jgi:hypothetical protein
MRKLGIMLYEVRDLHGRELYASDIEQEAAAFQRAQELADFYRRPVVVHRRVLGFWRRRVGGVVHPAPEAPIG